ncbi:MAG: GrpB family protein [Turneriella sp.]
MREILYPVAAEASPFDPAVVVVILNAPLRASDVAHAIGDNAPAYGIEIREVLDFNAVGSAQAVRQYLPANVVIAGQCNAAQIAELRTTLGPIDAYVYAYRPASRSLLMKIEGGLQSLRHLEAASRTADVGFPLPADTLAEFVANVFFDINDTGELAEPDANLDEYFRNVARNLSELLPEAQVHHIGSTALGIRAKPILDILVALPNDYAFSDVVPKLHQLGFYWVDYPGNTGRWYFRLGFPRKMHVHLVRQGSKEELVHLLFRDRLLASEQLRHEYEQLKIGLSSRFSHDRAAYGRAKSAFIESVIA